MKIQCLIFSLLLTVSGLAVSANLNKLVEAVDQDKAAVSVDTEKPKAVLGADAGDAKNAAKTASDGG